MRKAKVTPEGAEKTRGAVKGLAAIAGKLEGWKPAGEVLTRVRAVPTIFPQLDRATRVGGFPIERVSLIHGPSNGGKTMLALGLGLSFLERDHFFAFVDAEYTSPEQWLRELLGKHADHPGFVAKRPQSYEETVDSVRELANAVGAAKLKKEIPPDTSALVVVDSVRKLVPENFLEKIRRFGAEGKKGSVDGYQGRGAQLKAKMNSEWLDELTPMLYRTGTALLMIAREVDKDGADEWDRRAERDWKLTGGKALVFDSSLVCRVSRDAWVESHEGAVVGERIKVRIWKTKIGGKDGEHADAFFHTSNGEAAPAGFWRSRDVLELAELYEQVKMSGSWLKWGTYQKWNGRDAAIRWLDAHPAEVAKLEAECRERFKDDRLDVQIRSTEEP